MKKFCIMIIGLLSCTQLIKSQNLVVNPGFEDTVQCPSFVAQYDRCAGWTSCQGSPDYYHACSPAGTASVPLNYSDYQPAASGNAYFGLVNYYILGSIGEIRENICSVLSAPLAPGTKYFVSFKANLTLNQLWGSNCATNKIGAFFSTEHYYITNPTPITNNPQIYADAIINDTIGWTTVFGSFIADSAYDFISIGNFYDDANTDTNVLYSNGDILSYYLVDDVCVSQDSILASNWTTGIETIQNKMYYTVFPNPATLKSTIRFYHLKNENNALALFNSYGQMVSFINNISGQEIIIDRENLPAGLYYFHFYQDERIITSGKLTFID